jgi:ferritin-like metal-binding protein YciE
MAAKSMHDLFVDQLRDIYHAETQLTKALPKMAKAATDPELQDGFKEHLSETEGQIERLKEIGSELNIKLTGHPCEAMKGLIAEGEDIIGLGLEGEIQDAGLIAAAQKVEHYEIAMYGSLTTWAKQLGYENAQRLLHESLNEEKRTDEKLTHLAKSRVNAEAAAM